MILGHEWWLYVVFFFIGALTSAVNSVAGGGSSVSLPLMIFLGLPPTVANGTNRLGLLVGDIAAAVHMFRQGLLNVKFFRMLLWPTLVGSLCGVFFLTRINDRFFQGVLSIAIFFVVILSHLNRSFLGKPSARPAKRMSPFAFAGFFLIGVYGNVMQVGVGFVQIIALSRYTGLDLLRVNALKNALTGTFLLVSTIGLAGMGKVDWSLAVCVSAGSLLGGICGSLLQCKKGNAFIGRFVSVASLGLALFLIKDLFA